MNTTGDQIFSILVFPYIALVIIHFILHWILTYDSRTKTTKFSLFLNRYIPKLLLPSTIIVILPFLLFINKIHIHISFTIFTILCFYIYSSVLFLSITLFSINKCRSCKSLNFQLLEIEEIDRYTETRQTSRSEGDYKKYYNYDVRVIVNKHYFECSNCEYHWDKVYKKESKGEERFASQEYIGK